MRGRAAGNQQQKADKNFRKPETVFQRVGNHPYPPYFMNSLKLQMHLK